MNNKPLPNYQAMARIFDLGIGDAIDWASVLGIIAARIEETEQRLLALEGSQQLSGQDTRKQPKGDADGTN